MNDARDEQLLRAYLKGGSARIERADSTHTEEIQYFLQVFLTAGDEARAEGDLTKAERFYHETIKLAAAEFDESVPELALAKFHLSMIYLDRGTLVPAELFAKSALKIFMEIFGEDHPATGMALHQLAEVRLAQNKSNEASPLKEQATKILAQHYCEYANQSTKKNPSSECSTECAKANLKAVAFEVQMPEVNLLNN